LYIITLDTQDQDEII